MKCPFAACLLIFISANPFAWGGEPSTRERLAALTRALDQGTDEQRWQAVLDLADLGRAAAPLTGRLIEFLRSKNPELRLASALALGKVGKEAVPPLVKLLQDKDLEVRYLACFALGGNGAEARPAIDALLKARQPEHAEVYRRATVALGQIGLEPQKVLPVLVESLFREKEPAPDETVAAIARFGAGAIPYLEKKLAGGSSAGQLRVLDCLVRLGQPAWLAIVKAIDADDVEVRRRATAHLDGTGQSHPVVLAGLIHALENRDYETMVTAHIALGRRGEPAKIAIPTLIKVMFGPDALNHARSLETFRSLGHDPREELRAHLKAKERRTRALAGYWLTTRLGDNREECLKAMREGADLEDGEVRREILKALGRTGKQ